jgi:GR25 family glycosyltransferase involved in LPS biosynthesis
LVDGKCVKKNYSELTIQEKNPLNNFFTKIFVVNLDDKKQRLKKIDKQMKKNCIVYERFSAIDGRCSTVQECKKKRKILGKKYNVKIPNHINIPAASLVIGTILLLRKMVKQKWPRILICEDDINLDSQIVPKFVQGIKELKVEPNWDLLYLGCGNTCGLVGISDKKTSRNKYITSLQTVYKTWHWYVMNKDDLRIPCQDCEKISRHLSRPQIPSGTWCYAYSLSAAKKFLHFVGQNINDHIDQLLGLAIEENILNVVAFDPPIVWHEAGASRPDSDIPWEW